MGKRLLLESAHLAIGYRTDKWEILMFLFLKNIRTFVALSDRTAKDNNLTEADKPNDNLASYLERAKMEAGSEYQKPGSKMWWIP